MLNTILQLPPLTLIEVADKRALRDAFILPSRGRFEFPYWFFQHIHADGRLVVASPGGGRENIDAVDVMNIIRCEPVRTMAMPRTVFVERLALPWQERDRPAPAESFHPCSVMAAQRDRWGRFDYLVWFDDPVFNDSSTYFAPIIPGDRDRLATLTTRRTMPVRNLASASSWSCDERALRVERAHAKSAKSFLLSAITGDTRKVSKLCALDAIH